MQISICGAVPTSCQQRLIKDTCHRTFQSCSCTAAHRLAGGVHSLFLFLAKLFFSSLLHHRDKAHPLLPTADLATSRLPLTRCLQPFVTRANYALSARAKIGSGCQPGRQPETTLQLSVHRHEGMQVCIGTSRGVGVRVHRALELRDDGLSQDLTALL